MRSVERRGWFDRKNSSTERSGGGRWLGGDLTFKKRGPFRGVGKPLGDRDILSVCSYVVFTILITVYYYYYYFKRRSIKLNYGAASLKLVHSSLHGSDRPSWFALYICV